jgi:hypothetical protein
MAYISKIGFAPQTCCNFALHPTVIFDHRNAIFAGNFVVDAPDACAIINLKVGTPVVYKNREGSILANSVEKLGQQLWQLVQGGEPKIQIACTELYEGDFG